MDAASELGARWLDVAVPVILLVLMISMGTELVLADFRRVVELPRAAVVGLAGQMLLLPLAGLAFAHWPGFSPEVALGIVIIAACPGGATSNVFSYLARANVALSVTLTSLSCVLCFVTIPFWVGLGLDLFGDAVVSGSISQAAPLRLPFGRTAAQLFAVTLLPVAIGMSIRARWPRACERVRVPLRRAMAALMAVAIALIVGMQWDNVMTNVGPAALAALVLASTMLLAAHALARAARLETRDAFTIAIEVGLQNGALATLIVVSLLERPELIVFPGAYALLSFAPVSLFTLVLRARPSAAG